MIYMTRHFEGTDIIFDNLILSSDRGEDTDEQWELACWFGTARFMVIFCPSWKHFCKSDEDYNQLLIDVIHHEVLHGIFDYITDIDRLPVQDIHYPHYNGMDEPYADDWNSSLHL